MSQQNKEQMDELIKETRKNGRVGILNIVAVIVAAVPTALASIITNELGIVIVVFLISVLIALVIMVWQPNTKQGRNDDWYRWIWARETLRLYPKLTGFPMEDSYLMALRAHYQYALVEGRKELAEFLKSELDKDTRLIEKSPSD